MKSTLSIGKTLYEIIKGIAGWVGADGLIEGIKESNLYKKRADEIESIIKKVVNISLNHADDKVNNLVEQLSNTQFVQSSPALKSYIAEAQQSLQEQIKKAKNEYSIAQIQAESTLNKASQLSDAGNATHKQSRNAVQHNLNNDLQALNTTLGGTVQQELDKTNYNEGFSKVDEKLANDKANKQIYMGGS